ncbi:MAG TPA: type II toxin-antitoxin system VapC family toxin [Thermodesulfovibrionia bacterium]|nr:type II toxin-antitoxin system VapC family toxin [Thermodesulfovibrionia bacterium]
MTKVGNPVYVFDTSAWLTLIEDEAGADVVENLLESAGSGGTEILVSFMSFMEVLYITLQERDMEEAETRLNLMASLPIVRVESTASLSLTAGWLKAKHRISVADAWIAALAQKRGATLVHKDPEFDQIEKGLQVLRLPYKGKVNCQESQQPGLYPPKDCS